MRILDLTTWPRRQHFAVYSAFDYPHFSLCANVEITALHPLIKQRGLSFTVTLAYLLAKAANAIPEFRYRIRGQQVVEHAVVHPSTTLLAADDLFSFCTLPFTADFTAFAQQAAEIMARIKHQPVLADEPGQDDLLYLTGLPWVTFTSLTHPIHMHPADSVPRLSWGKFFTENAQLKMPLSVQVNHALMDGVHVGRYYQLIQEYFTRPETALTI